MLLTARGAETAGQVLARGATYVRRRLFAADVDPSWAGLTLAYGLAIFLVLLGSYRWIFDDAARWRVDQMPARARDMRSYNGADDRLVTLVDQMKLHNALVLTAPCSNWQCIGAVFWKNSPWLDNDVIYAKDLGPGNDEIFAAYPDRVVYRSTYLPTVHRSLRLGARCDAPGRRPNARRAKGRRRPESDAHPDEHARSQGRGRS